jgi:hypothetical protein
MANKQQELSGGDFQQVVDNFLSYYPEGFSGRGYFVHEREYKENAANTFLSKLNKENFANLLQNRAYKDICDHCTESCAPRNINFLHTIQWIQLKETLNSDESSRQMFAKSLYNVLYKGAIEHFDDFATTMDYLGISSWPRVTIFLFLADYNSYLCVRPTNIKIAEETFKFKINYKPDPSWAIYSRILDLARVIKEKLTEASKTDPRLLPKDMIDINSFLFMSQAINRPGFVRNYLSSQPSGDSENP